MYVYVYVHVYVHVCIYIYMYIYMYIYIYVYVYVYIDGNAPIYRWFVELGDFPQQWTTRGDIQFVCLDNTYPIYLATAKDMVFPWLVKDHSNTKK